MKKKRSTFAIDSSRAKSGILRIQATGSKKLVVRIMKDGITYSYNLNQEGLFEAFPLQMGRGTYTIQLFEHVSGDKYQKIKEKRVKLSPAKDFSYALSSNQYVNYEGSVFLAETIEKVCANTQTNQEKVDCVINYLSKTFLYDFLLSLSVKPDYLPNIDLLLMKKKGICFDFAALLAALLRAQGIPCKLVVGQADENYHTWNEVLVNEKWTTYDIAALAAGRSFLQYTPARYY